MMVDVDKRGYRQGPTASCLFRLLLMLVDASRLLLMRNVVLDRGQMASNG